MRIEYIVRSINKGKSLLGKYEGLYPFKHVGIKVIDGAKSEVYHVKKRYQRILSPIDIEKCSEEEFSSGLGVRSVIGKEVDTTQLNNSIKRMYRLANKWYFPVGIDCDRVVGIGYWGWLVGWILHRQLIVWLGICFLCWFVANGYDSAQNYWNPNTPILNWGAVMFVTLFSVCFVLIVIFKLNNTSAQRSSKIK